MSIDFALVSHHVPSIRIREIVASQRLRAACPGVQARERPNLSTPEFRVRGGRVRSSESLCKKSAERLMVGRNCVLPTKKTSINHLNIQPLSGRPVCLDGTRQAERIITPKSEQPCFRPPRASVGCPGAFLVASRASGVARTGNWRLGIGGYGKRASRHTIMKLASAAVR